MTHTIGPPPYGVKPRSTRPNAKSNATNDSSGQNENCWKLFPFSGAMAPLAEHYNRETRIEWEAVRDFIILHYKQTQRDDSEFWNYYRTMDIPDSLAHRMELFQENGHVWPDLVNLFRTNSWVQVMIGQGLIPKHRHGAGRILPPEALKLELEKLSAFVNHNLAKLPDHNDFIKQYCPAQN